MLQRDQSRPLLVSAAHCGSWFKSVRYPGGQANVVRPTSKRPAGMRKGKTKASARPPKRRHEKTGAPPL